MKKFFIVMLSFLVLISIIVAGNIHWNNKIAEAGKNATPENQQADTIEENEDESSSTIKEITATDNAWLYTHGNWDVVEVDGWGKVMQGTFSSTGNPAYDRRAKISTDSSFVTLKQRKTGGTVSVFVDGELVVTNELASDGLEKEIEIYTGSTGWHEIELAFSDVPEVSGIYISKDAEVRQPETNEEKLVVIGHNYVQAETNEEFHFTNLIENELGIETVNQGISGTDLNVNYPEDQENSGINRVEDDVIAEDPTGVLVVYGANALGYSDDGTMNYSAFYQDFVLFLQEIKNGLPDVPVYVSGLISTPNLNNQIVQRLNQNILAASWEIDNSTFIDLSGYWDSSNYTNYYTNDYSSLTVEGHQFLADQYTEAMETDKSTQTPE
ncbi:hypothetical protein GH741_00460 [Aquibacillus halophilus]|uniref:SGNH hydrolase-type esterase domain-containing protein n=1 Tax=Aquibacillus halophilus TaxID=930132 RepID=A0A6A8D6B2_9BACI|nr:hypothetical protein [Aquibacillus halophilus]MRH41144.1 hypothetical protein [Aquibacillus halophilus]